MSCTRYGSLPMKSMDCILNKLGKRAIKGADAKDLAGILDLHFTATNALWRIDVKTDDAFHLDVIVKTPPENTVTERAKEVAENGYLLFFPTDFCKPYFSEEGFEELKKIWDYITEYYETEYIDEYINKINFHQRIYVAA